MNTVHNKFGIQMNSDSGDGIQIKTVIKSYTSYFAGHLSPPAPYKRYTSPPRRPRSPRGPSIRFEQNNRNDKFQRRGDSAPRAIPSESSSQQQHQRNARDGEERSKNDKSENIDVKSKSLPPAKNAVRSNRETREAEEKKKQEEKEEEKRLEFEERLKRLPTPGTLCCHRE